MRRSLSVEGDMKHENWTKLVFPALILLLFIIAGCSQNEPVVKVPDSEARVKSGVEPSSGLGLDVTAITRDGAIYVEIKNNTPAPVAVSPFYFGLIIDNKRPVITYNPAKARAEFPVTSLTSGARAAGLLHFNDYPDVAGQKLIFNSPDYKPMMTIIRPER